MFWTLPTYLFFVVVSALCAIIGGWLGGSGKSRTGGIAVCILGGVIYLLDNVLVLFVWVPRLSQ